jgi:hypothetical protein
MKKILCLVVLLILSSIGVAFSQSAPPNMPHYDSKIAHFGISFGYNQFYSNMIEKEFRPYQDTIMGFNSDRNSGFQLMFITDLRLLSFLNLRFTPGVTFGDRRLNFYEYNKDGEFMVKSTSLEAIYVEMPLEFKIRSKRWRDMRPYLIAGGKYAYDLGSIKRKKANPDDVMLKIDNSEIFYTLGAGVDFYLPYFKFGVELKTSYGLTNILLPEHHTMYSDVLDKIRTQVFYINLTFE